MRAWLTDVALRSSVDLPEEFEGYVLGRGLPYKLMEEMKIGLFRTAEEPAPEISFQRKHGNKGEKREGCMVVPLWSPRGRLVGVEYRTWRGEKEVRDFRLPDAAWNPVFIGLTPSVLQKIWDGGDVWLVEGVFDLALTHVLPEKDVALACGTARITRNQVDFLQRFLGPAAMVHVAFDEDETGRKHVSGYTDEKTGRWIQGVTDRLERVHLTCRAVRYRGGKDPGEIWESGGKEALRKSFKL